MPSLPPTHRPIAAAPSPAAQWFARMRDDQRTPEEEATFNRWLAEDPANERAYQRLTVLWGRMDGVRDTPEIAAARSAALLSPLPFKGGRPRVRGPWIVAAASIALIFVIVLAASHLLLADRVYQTTVGDRKIIQLTDGSELTLNTDSIARVHYELWTRTVHLERGQAHFKVARNPLRPFSVEAGRGTIRALGTEFDVYRSADEIKVTLVEGRVEVEDKLTDDVPDAFEAPQPPAAHKLQLVPGQQISVSPAGLSKVTAANLPRATAWLEGRLVFDNERLQDAVTEVNRYSAVKLLILNPELADFRVSGVFRTDRADSFLDAVQTSLPIKVVPAAGGALVIAPETSD